MMKIKGVLMSFLKIFFAALVSSLACGFFEIWGLARFHPGWFSYWFLRALFSFALPFVAVCLVWFFTGKNIDLREKITIFSVLVFLFLGNFFGFSIGFSVGWVVSFQKYPSLTPSFIYRIFYFALALLFVNFSAIALEYLMRPITRPFIISKTPFCSNCGTRVEPGALFCSNCGKKIG